MRFWQERHSIIWLSVRVAAEHNSEGGRGATLPFASAFAEKAPEAVPPTGNAQAKFPCAPFADNTHARIHQTILREIAFALCLVALLPASIERDIPSLSLFVDMVLHPREDILRILEVDNFISRAFPSSICFSNGRSVPHSGRRIGRDETWRRAQRIVRRSSEIVPPIYFCRGALHFVLVRYERLFSMHPSLKRFYLLGFEELGGDAFSYLLQCAILIKTNNMGFSMKVRSGSF